MLVRANARTCSYFVTADQSRNRTTLHGLSTTPAAWTAFSELLPSNGCLLRLRSRSKCAVSNPFAPESPRAAKDEGDAGVICFGRSQRRMYRAKALLGTSVLIGVLCAAQTRNAPPAPPAPGQPKPGNMDWPV